MTDQATELLRQFLSRDPRVVFTGNMLDAARDEIERLRALTRPPSERPSEAAVAWRCAARRQSLPEPADCNWPDCGCDPYATKVIEALLEQGWSAIQHEEPGRKTKPAQGDGQKEMPNELS